MARGRHESREAEAREHEEVQWTKHASRSDSQAQQHDLTGVLEERVYALCPQHMSTITNEAHPQKGWRFSPDAILSGHRRALQWVAARTPTVHWGPVNGEAVGGPHQRHKGEVPSQ